MSASTQYQHRRTRAIAYGQWEPWVNPGPVRSHVRHLRHQGGSYAAISRAAGVSAATVYNIETGKRRIASAVAAALLSLTADDLAQLGLRADGTRLRLRSLIAMGHDCTRLARAVDAKPVTIRKIVQGRASEVTLQLHARVRALWEAWWDKTPPQRTPAQRAAAANARRTARRRNWCTPLGLDEDCIDLIGYQPTHGWLPATGTGPAPDLPDHPYDQEERTTSPSREVA
jgi:AcrR family transcriptional regulator